jgi:tripartite-type tricarboxylate transporter receptor subunit TctC
MKPRHWKSIFSVAVLLALSAAAGPSMAEDYPSKAIHMVVPWAAGGGTDSIGRGIAEAMKEAAGVPVVVDNISGAAGATGSIKVAKSNPDGYTLLMNGETDLVSALIFTDVQVPLSLDDFVYIGGFYDSPTWILSHKDAGIDSMESFLKMAREKPGKMTLGSATPGGAQMIMAAAIKGKTALNFRIIPYQGGNDLKKALLGNQVDAGIIHAPVLLGEVKAGLIKVIGTGKPLTLINYEPVRKVKTLKDIGIPVSIGITRGIFVPKKTPPEIKTKLANLVEKAAKSGSFKAFGEKFGFAPTWIPGPEFEKQTRESYELFKEVKVKYLD